MYGLILAGGSGSRLWPLSRELYPKQLLNLQSEESLIQSTFERLSSFIESKKIISITNNKHFANVKSQLQNIFKDSVVLSEPIARNTAPAIAISIKYIMENSDETDPIILVVPSDHLIKNKETFKKNILKGEQLANEGYLVTFGIQPNYPETGYGYINISDEAIDDGFRVNKFVEKPDLKTAQAYLDAKTYFWNSGIFMFKASIMLKELEKSTPEIFKLLDNFDFKESCEIPYVTFDKMPNISLDYAVMEKSDKIALIKLESDWNDLGSWQAIYDISEKDPNGNVFVGNVLDAGSKNSLIYSSSRLIATIGLEDTVLVETEDAILACKSNKTQEVKKVFDKLKKINDTTHKVHKTVVRPWGFYTVLSEGKGFITKRIHVDVGQKLSVQSHNHRAEHWVVTLGKAKILLDDKEYILNVGESLDIPVKGVHSLQNPYDSDLEIMEVQLGELLSEDDIIRYEDMYGRV